MAALTAIDPDAFEASLWWQTARTGAAFPILSGSRRADVAVVGAGIAGLSTALHLAEKGIDVVVLEAGEPGFEATGRSGGIIAPDFVLHSPLTVQRKFGAGQGERFARLVGGSARFVFDLIGRHDIDCDVQANGFLWPAHNMKTVRIQKQRQADWARLGFDVACLSAPEAARLVGSRRYLGALLYRDGGAINPLAFARGLATATVGLGGAVFAHSPVTMPEKTARGWRLRTAEGEVTAPRLILAANGGNAALHPALRRTIVPLHVYEYATAPLAPRLKRKILVEGHALTDKQRYMFTARFDGAGRLISGFPSFLLHRDRQRILREATRRLGHFFPSLADVEVAHLWRGTAWLNSSLLPALYDLADGALAIQACNGRGLALNAALGQEVADWLASGAKTALSVPLQAPRPFAVHAVAKYLPDVLMAATRSLACTGTSLDRVKGRAVDD